MNTALGFESSLFFFDGFDHKVALIKCWATESLWIVITKKNWNPCRLKAEASVTLERSFHRTGVKKKKNEYNSPSWGRKLHCNNCVQKQPHEYSEDKNRMEKKSLQAPLSNSHGNIGIDEKQMQK